MGHTTFERRHLRRDVDHAWLRAGGAEVVIDCPHLHAGWPCAGWIRAPCGSECALGPPVESPTLSTGIAAIAHIVVNCVHQDPTLPPDLPHRGRPDLFHRRKPARRCLLQCENRVQLGTPGLVHPAGHQNRERRELLRRRPQPVVPVELGYVGDQRGVVAAHRNTSGRAGGLEREPHDLPGNRDSRGRRSEPEHPVLPSTPGCLSARIRGRPRPRPIGTRPLIWIGTIRRGVSGLQSGR